MAATWAFNPEVNRAQNLLARRRTPHRVALYVKLGGVWQRYGKGSARNRAEAGTYFAMMITNARALNIPNEFRPVLMRKWRHN